MDTIAINGAIDAFKDVIENPSKLISEWKELKKKIVGYRCIYVPEEIISAADMLPYPLYGTQEAISRADSYFQSCVCEFIRNIFDHALDGKLSFLDGVVVPNTCDAIRKFHDYWNGYIETSSCYIINNPQKLCCSENSELYKEELKSFKAEMEKLSGNIITDEKLKDAIEKQNEIRRLMKELYNLRKADTPPITGTEALNIAMATTLMPKDMCIIKLKELLLELESREMPEVDGPRILLTGSIVDNPALITIIENEGGVVVADDLCNTMKNFWYEMDNNDDPIESIYQFNNMRPLCPCMNPPEIRFDYLMELVNTFNVDAVIYFNLKYCHPFMLESTDFQERFAKKGIPIITLETGHDLSGLGQLHTRIQAFLEMLEFDY